MRVIMYPYRKYYQSYIEYDDMNSFLDPENLYPGTGFMMIGDKITTLWRFWCFCVMAVVIMHP